MGKSVYFYTNDSTRTREGVNNKLQRLGIDVSPSNIYNASYVVVQYINLLYPYIQKVFTIGHQGLIDELQRANLKVIQTADFNLENKELLSGIQLDNDIDAVVMGHDDGFNYNKLTLAGILLNRPRCMFLATNADDYDVIDGIRHPENGSFLAAVRAFTGRAPDAVTGKPNPFMFSLLQRDHPHVVSHRTCMVGDRLDTDMVFARKNGLKKMLTFSGVSQSSNLDSLVSSDIDYFIQYIGRIYEIIKLS